MGFQLPTSTSRISTINSMWQKRTYTLEAGASTLLASFAWRQTNQSSNFQSTVLFQWWQRLAGYGIYIYIVYSTCIHILFTYKTYYNFYNQTLKKKQKQKKRLVPFPEVCFMLEFSKIDVFRKNPSSQLGALRTRTCEIK